MKCSLWSMPPMLGSQTTRESWFLTSPHRLLMLSRRNHPLYPSSSLPSHTFQSLLLAGVVSLPTNLTTPLHHRCFPHHPSFYLAPNPGAVAETLSLKGLRPPYSRLWCLDFEQQQALRLRLQVVSFVAIAFESMGRIAARSGSSIGTTTTGSLMTFLTNTHPSSRLPPSPFPHLSFLAIVHTPTHCPPCHSAALKLSPGFGSPSLNSRCSTARCNAPPVENIPRW